MRYETMQSMKIETYKRRAYILYKEIYRESIPLKDKILQVIISCADTKLKLLLQDMFALVSHEEEQAKQAFLLISSAKNKEVCRKEYKTLNFLNSCFLSEAIGRFELLARWEER